PRRPDPGPGRQPAHRPPTQGRHRGLSRPGMTVQSYLRDAPKVELHLHLEGAAPAETVLALAGRNGVALPEDVARGLREGFRFRDFEQFIQTYIAVTRCLRNVDDYAQMVFDVAARLHAQHVRYAEVTFSPSTHGLFLGVPERVFLEGLARGRRRAHDEL